MYACLRVEKCVLNLFLPAFRLSQKVGLDAVVLAYSEVDGLHTLLCMSKERVDYNQVTRIGRSHAALQAPQPAAPARSPSPSFMQDRSSMKGGGGGERAGKGKGGKGREREVVQCEARLL